MAPHKWAQLLQGAPAHCSSTWHTRAAPAQGLLQIGFLCHRHRRDITGTEKTPTPWKASTITHTAPNKAPGLSLGRAPLPKEEHMVLRSRRGCLPDQHSQILVTAWQGEHSSVFSLAFHVISSWWKKKRGTTGAVSDSWPEPAQRSLTQTPLTVPRCHTVLQLPGNTPAPGHSRGARETGPGEKQG